jgi:glycosyltransferase involved in cell wall biosynthesis
MANDILVFQRPDEMNRLNVAKLLKQAGKKIVFENDDTYKIDGVAMKQMLGLDAKLQEKNEALDEFIKEADLVTTTTEFLAEEYRKLNPNVVVLPNCVDPTDWDEPQRNEGDKVRIGLVGSVTSNGDFDSAREALEALNKMPNVQLVMFGLPAKSEETKEVTKLYKEEFDFWNTLNIEWQPFVPMEDYFDTLNNLKLDIMLIPRKDNYFNRCKSNIKFLEAGMLEIPCIAQGFPDGNSPYDADIDGKNGILIKDNSKWLEEIMRLVNDKKLRRSMGKKAKEYVLSKYDIKNNAIKWQKAYESIK